MAAVSSGRFPQIEFDAIPGTVVFDSRKARKGYALNKMSAALKNADDRAAFLADEEAFMERFGLSEAQKDAVRRRDWMKMLELGGNIYFCARIGLVEGLSVQDIDAQMTGVTTEEFTKMLAEGGRKHG